jgi:hypothetical protein
MAFGDPAVQRLRSDVGPVGPNDGAQLPVELDAGEVNGIGEGRKDAAPRFGAEVQLALRTVLEAQAKPMSPRDSTAVTLMISAMG